MRKYVLFFLNLEHVLQPQFNVQLKQEKCKIKSVVLACTKVVSQSTFQNVT